MQFGNLIKKHLITFPAFNKLLTQPPSIVSMKTTSPQIEFQVNFYAITTKFKSDFEIGRTNLHNVAKWQSNPLQNRRCGRQDANLKIN